MVVDGRLFVADRGNKRLLIWNTVPTASGVAPDKVVDTPALFRFGLPDWFDGDVLAPAGSRPARTAMPSANGADHSRMKK